MFGLFICVSVIMLFLRIIDGLILKNVGFYSMRFVYLFGLIELILCVMLCVSVGLIVYFVM